MTVVSRVLYIYLGACILLLKVDVFTYLYTSYSLMPGNGTGVEEVV